jgi:hypothetical protein
MPSRVATGLMGFHLDNSGSQDLDAERECI